MWRSDPAGLPYVLDKQRADDFFLGTDPWDAHVFLGDASALPRIRPLHAVLSPRSGERWSVRPKDGPVFVNREPLAGERILEDGDCILLPGLIIQFWAGRLENVPLPAPVAALDDLGAYMDELGQSVRVDELSDDRNGVSILSKISFSAKDGEFIGILGPSGCGKSSLIQRLAGLAWPNNGRDCIFYDDVPFNRNSADRLRHLIAYVPQEADACLHANLSVLQELDCHLRLRSAQTEADDAKMRAALVSLGLWSLRKKRVGELSGGERRRLSVSLALLRRPQLMLLDEPTSGLDPASEASLMQYLRKLSKQGCTVVCSTHMLANIDQFTHVLVLNAKGTRDRWCKPAELLEGDDSLPKMYERLSKGKRSDTPPRIPFDWLLRCRDRLVASVAGCFNSFCRHTKDWRRLFGRSNSLRISDSVPEAAETKSAPRACPAWRTIGGYLKRRFWALAGAPVRILREKDAEGHARGEDTSRMMRLDRGVRAFAAALPGLWLFAIQPIAMAIAIRFAVSEKFTNMVATDYTVVSFCASLAAFWLGMSYSVRFLVGERVPGRCLERLDGVSIGRYLSAQFLWCVLAAAVQMSFFLIPFLLWQTIPSAGDRSWQPDGFFVHWIVLAVVHLTGGIVGLVVSAAFRRETTAISWIPLLGMIVLLLGAPVLGFNPHKETRGGGLSESIARDIMPCTPAERILDASHRLYSIKDSGSDRRLAPPGNNEEGALDRPWGGLFGRFLLYALLGLFLSYHFQKGNESEWEGR